VDTPVAVRVPSGGRSGAKDPRGCVPPPLPQVPLAARDDVVTPYCLAMADSGRAAADGLRPLLACLGCK